MILTFPDLDTVRLALTSGAVAAAAALAPAVARFEADGRVWVETTAELPRKALAELRRLGAATGKPPATVPAIQVSCWLQLLPLQRSADPVARPGQAPVLFELAEGEPLSSLVSEVLRLGNDRQGYRRLDDPQGKNPGRVLLRVVEPPYYSLLRAIDRDGQASAPVAYVEQAPRVWVQLGYRHPLGDHLKPPPGQLLFLRPPRRWAVIEDAPFRDIYEVLEFTLPGQKTRWQEGELGRRLTVPLRLGRGGPSAAPGLWVLRERPVDQLDELVRGADDALLSRLAFAVGEKGGEKVIVLKVRPSKQAPPALVLDAVDFCHFQRMPNLFLPAGTRLNPPLRRDAVRRLLADDPTMVTWLYPGPDGGFTPESLPDSAFRPLSDWIDYVLEHDHEALQAWVESARFEFEPFVCDEDEPGDRPKKPLREPRAKAPPRSSAPRPGGKAEKDGNAEPKKAAPDQAPEAEPLAEAAAAPPDELRQQLTALEQRFLDVDGGLDAPERLALWPEMAALNARLNSVDDAGVCWLNAMWAEDESPAARALAWFRAEAQAVPARKEAGWPKGRTWATAAALAPRGAAVEAAHLDLLLNLKDPSSADVRALAAYVFWAGCQKQPPEALLKRLGPVGHFLEAHGESIPVRAVWLASLGRHRLSGGDALGLARARDRLLERLFRNGLRPEQDLASFLRFSGPAGNQRFRTVRQWLAALCDKARRWVEEKGRITPTSSNREPRTTAYIDLLFAFGLAKLGETEACNRLRERATTELIGEGEAHEFLLQAYDYRIRQALDGKPHAGPLPAEQMDYLAELMRQRKEAKETSGTGPVYVIDRLRWLSRILEPDQRVEPYRHTTPFMNDLERAVRELPDMADRDQLAERVRGLLHRVPKGKDAPEVRARVLRAALDQAPRVGEDFSAELLAHVPAAFDALPPAAGTIDFADQADLLEKALFVAAHFDRKEDVQQLVTRFGRLLETQRDAPTVEALDSLAAQSFRGLRKLGMQQEIRNLLKLLKDVLLRDRDLSVLEDPQWRARQPAALRALLHVAASWYYFGDYGQAEVVLKAARGALLAPLPKGADRRPAVSGREVKDRTALARAYAAALGQAPVEMAQRNFEELFEKLDGILDTFTTNDHYSQCQLQVVEAVVLAVVSDDFTVGPAVRRWLDEDEYLVRRRIHQDVRAMVSH
jgi:hypothetical protein